MAIEVTATSGDKIRCDACPVMCYIKPGAAGACDRYANHDGELVRVDPHIVLERTVEHGGRLVPFQAGGDWDGKLVKQPEVFVTAIGAGTTYPDYKPAPVHRLVGDRRRRHGHGRDRRHLQLLRRQGEDRHRPPSRPGNRDGARAGRGGRPRHHRRIRLADAVARRRASSDRRLEEGRPRHLRHADGSQQLQAGRAHHRWRRQRHRAGRLSADRQRRCRGAHARRLRLGHHRHVRQAVARQGRRGRRRRRPHHRRVVASIRPASCSISPTPASR